MDLQRNIVERYPDPLVLEHAAEAAAAARAAGVPVVFVRVAFREGLDAGGVDLADRGRRRAAAR